MIPDRRPDGEWVDWLRSLPRESPAEQSMAAEALRDAERGLYVPHGGIVHHVTEESRH